jgi:hypothetical protein
VNTHHVGKLWMSYGACVLSPPPTSRDGFALWVTLQGIKPAVWRAVTVPVVAPLSMLHEVLQIAFGWEDAHLHEFDVGGIRFAPPSEEEETFVVDEMAAALGAVTREGSRFIYRYDYGDDWEHEVLVESVVANGGQGITCTGGAQACPPEDCGGPSGYAHLLKVLASPKSREHADMKEWVGGKFDSTRFDLAAVNKRLAAYSKRLFGPARRR